MLATEL